MRTMVAPGRYQMPAYRKFVEDCIAAGLIPYHYQGRHYYEGPAVDVDYPEEIPQTVPLQRDNMGKGWVFYPTGNLKRTYRCRGCDNEAERRVDAAYCCGEGAILA